MHRSFVLACVLAGTAHAGPEVAVATVKLDGDRVVAVEAKLLDRPAGDYLLVDTTGVVATLATHDSGDKAGCQVAAHFVARKSVRLPSGTAVVVGPVVSRPKARLLDEQETLHQKLPYGRDVLAVDLDGDGTADLARMTLRGTITEADKKANRDYNLWRDDFTMWRNDKAWTEIARCSYLKKQIAIE